MARGFDFLENDLFEVHRSDVHVDIWNVYLHVLVWFKSYTFIL